MHRLEGGEREEEEEEKEEEEEQQQQQQQQQQQELGNKWWQLTVPQQVQWLSGLKHLSPAMRELATRENQELTARAEERAQALSRALERAPAIDISASEEPAASSSDDLWQGIFELEAERRIDEPEQASDIESVASPAAAQSKESGDFESPIRKALCKACREAKRRRTGCTAAVRPLWKSVALCAHLPKHSPWRC